MLLVLAGATAHAGLPASVPASAGALRLASCGVRSVFWLDLYKAALYVPSGQAPLEAVEDDAAPKELRVRIIDPQFFPPDLPPNWRRPLERTLSAEELETLENAYRQLKPGDELVVSYDGSGTLVIDVDGRPVLRKRDGLKVIEAVLTEPSGPFEDDTLGKLLQKSEC
jgi:hypothetical protein